MCFIVDFWRSLGTFFSRFGSRSVPNGSYLGTFFQTYCSKGGKPSGFMYTTHYFLEIWGAGFGRVGQFFSRKFIRWVWRSDFTIFWEIEGPAGSSKDVFWWAFQVQMLHRFLMNFQWRTGSTICQEVPAIYLQSEP